MACSSPALPEFKILLFSVSMHYLIPLMFPQSCIALYEDQVGLFDWRQQYIGKVNEAYFEQLSHSSRRVYVSTEAGVVAALNARTGTISWRKILEKKYNGIENLLYDTKYLITISNDGKVVYSWETSKGHLIWESSMEPSVSHGTILRPAQNITFNHKAVIQESGGIALMSQGIMYLLALTDGSLIWETTVDNNTDGDISYIGVAAHAGCLFAFFLEQFKHNLIVKKIDIDDGKTISHIFVPVLWNDRDIVNCELISSNLVCLDKSRRKIYYLDYTALTDNMESKTLESLNFPADAELLGIESLDKDRAFFSVKSLEYVQLLNIMNGSFEVVKKIDSCGVFAKGSLGSKTFIFSITVNNESIIVEVFSSRNLELALNDISIVVPYDKINHGCPLKGKIFMYSKKSDIGYRILLTSQDHSVRLIQIVTKGSGKVLWEREESLAAIATVEMMELPPSTSASKLELLHDEFSISHNAGIISMFLSRVKSQIKQFQTFTQTLKRKQQRTGGIKGLNGHDKYVHLQRDQFGIHRVIVLITEAKKIFAINSQNGDIVWSRFIADLIPFGGVEKKHFYLIQQRTTAHFPLPPQCMLVGLSAKKGCQGNVVIYSFNPLTGSEFSESLLLSDEVVRVTQLPIEDERSAKAISLVDASLNLHIFPKTDEILKKVDKASNSIFHYLVNHLANTISGYYADQSTSILDDPFFKLREVWTLNIPSDQRLLDVVTKGSNEVVNSVGRVLGDHTVLYKYLNPNLIAFTTVQDQYVKGSTFVYVVDAVTGHLVYHARHKSAATPVNLILSEHWLVYVYYNPKGKRNELAVVEFYEDGKEKKSTAFSSLDPASLPLVQSQCYIIHSNGIQAIATTLTERGITHKNILIALESGYILSLPKNFLDPRRRFEHSVILAEEGLAPYIPEIAIMPQSFINYNSTVSQIRGIYTSAAGLESTSLVLAHGLDLYFTRVMPSKMFDVLKEDFDYIFISGVLSALILSTILCSKLASIKSLSVLWK